MMTFWRETSVNISVTDSHDQAGSIKQADAQIAYVCSQYWVSWHQDWTASSGLHAHKYHKRITV